MGTGCIQPEGHPRSFLQRGRRPYLALGDGGRPSWRRVVGVVLPPVWHQGHKGQSVPRVEDRGRGPQGPVAAPRGAPQPRWEGGVVRASEMATDAHCWEAGVASTHPHEPHSDRHKRPLESFGSSAAPRMPTRAAMNPKRTLAFLADTLTDQGHPLGPRGDRERGVERRQRVPFA
jgi:hypothetical protein